MICDVCGKKTERVITITDSDDKDFIRGLNYCLDHVLEGMKKVLSRTMKVND